MAITRRGAAIAHLPLDAIARDGIADFAADRDPQSTLLPAVSAADDDEIGRLKLGAHLRQFLEFPTLAQPRRFRQPLRAL
jgi:hypothetical protein